MVPCEALENSIDIIKEDFYKSSSTDIKFVSLSPNSFQKPIDEHADFEAVICISGFLSQRDDLQDSWHGVLDNVDPEKPVFGYKWPAEDYLSIFNRILLEIVNIRFEKIKDISIGDIMAFNGVREIAMESGKLLAHALILEYPEYLPRVSLVSFSLGTEVVRSCIEELHRLGVKDIIQDVYLLGGATTINEIDYPMFDVLNGKLVQVYTPSDRILDFYELATAEIPIGQDKLSEELTKRIENLGVKVEQYDITGISNGHTKYRSYLNEILQKVGFH
mmetsp:Transcript_38603/g.38139  ORF Transcript_38603/g.38139 Transcript_38603/m.38139 type:complete len:276 (+) Transcript_38603:348-1175(+)|eukprot:CAMPEP_0197016268 /NCGR_PEP_ID=MMETSP1380-20130617/77615_1 /TAXON_ID=5936 /ORGANISM="Euplotes crassus, Strain CT5" /LENGTH=275 /DNA_ID=CAMNT_0042442927 /DNA_START=347 /DNA_END=1174 /DNA_ORIENTATION=+